MNEKDKKAVERQQYEEFLDWYGSKKELGIFEKDLNASEDIPVEVWERVEKGETLKSAFMDHFLSTQKERIEQETIKKLKDNNSSSPGSTQEGTNTKSEEKWTKDFVAKMAREKGNSWIEANWKKIEDSGYFG